ncbi:hypothetical protein Fot_50626 [Forsythia ovata]|uniref:Uncharacterized protein n=1 Tax=Forsythia ovata TaxID=205694 RepID=A0ABD1PYP9_9LAMI
MKEKYWEVICHFQVEDYPQFCAVAIAIWISGFNVFGEELAMTKEEASKKCSRPEFVKLDKAFKLAEQWVNNMSKSSEGRKSIAIELEGRPARLGIGATVPRGSKVVNSSDPVERKLLAKLDAEKRKVVKRAEEFAPSSKDGNVDEDGEDELESKTKAFAKKRPLNTISPLQRKKKHK